MNNFSDFNITLKEPAFVGRSINVNKVIDQEIEVFHFVVKPSKFAKEGKSKDCLHMQISYEGEKRVIFVGAKSLIELISQVSADKFPFKTKIKRENNLLKFT